MTEQNVKETVELAEKLASANSVSEVFDIFEEVGDDEDSVPDISDEPFVQSPDAALDSDVSDARVIYNVCMPKGILRHIRVSDWELHSVYIADENDTEEIREDDGIRAEFNYVGDSE